MTVVGVAVVGRAGGDDGFQCRRAVACHLQRIEAAPGNAHHTDRPAAPGLSRKPGDDLDRVGLLLRQIFVREQPVGIAGAAHIDTHRGIAVTGEIGVHLAVAQHGAVTPPIGQEFENRRYRIFSCVLGQPDRGGQACAIGQNDPFGRNGPYPTGKFGDRFDVHDCNLG